MSRPTCMPRWESTRNASLGGFFLQSSLDSPTASGIAFEDATLVEIFQWLRLGAMIAVEKCHDDRCG